MLIGLLLVAGCAHSPPSPLPDSMQQQLGEIEVASRPEEGQETLHVPQSGRLSDMGRGAFLGTLMGFSIGWFEGLGVLGAPIGLAMGTIYGAVHSESESWQEADATFRAVVAELDLNRALPEHLIAFSRSHGYEIANLGPAPREASEHQAREAAASRTGIDTVLEIRDLRVDLYPAELPVNPRRRLTVSARFRLVRTSDGTVLDEREVIDTFGPALDLHEWTAHRAMRFGQEVELASERMAEEIVTQYFMLSRFPERVFNDGFYDVHLRGLRPYSPREEAHPPGDLEGPVTGGLPLDFQVMALSVDSLQPTMEWEEFPGDGVTYDLIIWRSDRLGIDTVVYSRTNLEETSHTLENELEPMTGYFWSVRAHYSEDGRDRITAWSRRTVKFGLPLKILVGVGTLGIGALPPAVLYDGFYVFTTPPFEQNPEPDTDAR